MVRFVFGAQAKDDGSTFVIDGLDDTSVVVCFVNGASDGDNEVSRVPERDGTRDFFDLGGVIDDDDIAGSDLLEVLDIFAVGACAGSVFNPILTVPGTERCRKPVIGRIRDNYTDGTGEPGRGLSGERFNGVIVSVRYVDPQVQVGAENVLKNPRNGGGDNLPPKQGGVDH